MSAVLTNLGEANMTTFRSEQTVLYVHGATFKSMRPSEMADKPEANPPIVRGEPAAKDIDTVVDFILQRRSIPSLNPLGWSWGTTLIDTLAGAGRPGSARRLPGEARRPR